MILSEWVMEMRRRVLYVYKQGDGLVSTDAVEDHLDTLPSIVADHIAPQTEALRRARELLGQDLRLHDTARTDWSEEDFVVWQREVNLWEQQVRAFVEAQREEERP